MQNFLRRNVLGFPSEMKKQTLLEDLVMPVEAVIGQCFVLCITRCHLYITFSQVQSSNMCKESIENPDMYIFVVRFCGY